MRTVQSGTWRRQLGRVVSRLPLIAIGIAMLMFAACGGEDDDAPVGGPGTGPGSGAATPEPGSGLIVAPLQIQQVDVLIAESFPPMVSARVVAVIPDACTTPRQPEISRGGQQITVRLLGERPAGLMCAQVIREHEQTIPLGSFEPGTYTLTVNEQTTTFRVQ